MSIEWKRLVDLRERHQQLAREVVGRDRRAAEEGEVQARVAQAQLQEQIHGKASHWQAIASALDGGRCDVSHLRDAGAWSRALDERITQAGEGVSQAQAIVAERQEALEASQRQLRSTMAETERAKRMAQRVALQRQHLQEVRCDDAAEEAAAQAWVSRRSN